MVNAPHNPTGMLPTAAEWRALTDLCAEAGVHLFADEVYRFLEFDEGDRLTAGADALERGISLGVMSKSFAMAGLRIGWLASRDRDLLARAAAFKDYTTICASAPAEILSIVALRARDGGPRPVARASSRRTCRSSTASSPSRADAFRWVRPRAGSVAFPRLTVPGLSIDDFAAGLVEAEGVLLLPGSRFGFPGDHFRIGLGRTDLPEAVAGLEAYAAAGAARPAAGLSGLAGTLSPRARRTRRGSGR